jgi:hypothetical protein
MDLYKELGEALRPENSKQALAEKENEIRAIAEDAIKLVVDSDSPHYRNYVLMYMLGYQDCKLNQRSNLLDLIKK